MADPKDTQGEEVTWSKKTERQLARWSEKDGEETLTIELGITVKYPTGQKATIPILRKEIGTLITQLSRYLANAKIDAGEHKLIQISLDEVPGRPYKTINTTVGQEVPEFPWTRGPIPEVLRPVPRPETKPDHD